LDFAVLQQRTRLWMFLAVLGLSATAHAATDIDCSTARAPGQRVVCDYTIVGHEYDELYAQQQRMAASGVLSQGQVADFRARRDACADVGCVEKVIADWQTHAAALNRAQTDAAGMQGVGGNGAVSSAASMPAATDQPPPPPTQDPNAPPSAAQTQFGAPTQMTNNLVPVSPDGAASGASVAGAASAAAGSAATASDPSTLPTAERNALSGSQDDRPSTGSLLRNGALLIILVAIGTAIWRTRRRLRGRNDNRRGGGRV